MTVLEGIQKSADFLARKDVESPRLQAELLLAHVLKLPRMKLYLNFERALTDAETDAFRELVKRRSQREPLQHILGSTSFCGFEIAVNRSVLVARPETEILAEVGWQFLNGGDVMISPPSPSRSGEVGRGEVAPGAHGEKLTALDFGTGSGCIAIALAAKCPNAKILALDVSLEALETARQNAARNNVADKIEFVQGDGFGALRNNRPSQPLGSLAAGDLSPHASPVFDLIISNPPYIPSAEIETLQPEVRDFDPRAALDGGPDGLDFYRRFAIDARPSLQPGGKIMLEFGDGQAGAIRKIFEAQNWIVEAIREDYTHRPRILIARC